jgi:hypothetical protein
MGANSVTFWNAASDSRTVHTARWPRCDEEACREQHFLRLVAVKIQTEIDMSIQFSSIQFNSIQSQ